MINDICNNPNPESCELYDEGCFLPSHKCEHRDPVKTARYWARRAHKAHLNTTHDQHSAELGFIIHALVNLIESLETWAMESRADSKRITAASAASDWKHAIDALRYLLRTEMSDVRVVAPMLRLG